MVLARKTGFVDQDFTVYNQISLTLKKNKRIDEMKREIKSTKIERDKRKRIK